MSIVLVNIYLYDLKNNLSKTGVELGSVRPVDTAYSNAAINAHKWGADIN